MIALGDSRQQGVLHQDFTIKWTPRLLVREGASGETVGFLELGGYTLLTPPVADIDDFSNLRCIYAVNFFIRIIRLGISNVHSKRITNLHNFHDVTHH